MENEKVTACSESSEVENKELQEERTADFSATFESNNGGKDGKNGKKSLKWLWISIALAIVAALAAWCIVGLTKAEDVEKVTGVNLVVALLFGIFLVAALGYLLGSISIKGVSLGTAGVFLVAIVFGCVCTIEGLGNIPILKNFYIKDSSAILYKYYGSIVQNIGLVLFVASVGFIAGPSFFKNLKKNAKSYVLLGVIIILVGAVCSVAFTFILGEDYGGADFAIGVLSGALTTTPGYSAALEAASSEAAKSMITLGHAIAYPFGVVGVVLFVQLVPKFMKADMEKERGYLKLGLDEKVKLEGGFFKADEFGVMPFALAAICGLILGAIKIPLTSKGYNGTCFSLGTTGGVLIMCLIFGHFGHFGRLSLEIPDKTAKVFREFGLMLFLIGAGVAGGAQLVTQISKYGGIIILYGFLGGVVMTTLPMIVGFFVAKKGLKLPLLNNLGSITGGMTSTPALGTLISVAGTDDVASAYAATYPMALVSIVLVSQFVVTLL